VQAEPPDPLTMDEVELVLVDLATRVDPQTANYFEVAFFTGLRPSEQIALHWIDYARKEGRLRVHRARVWGKDKPRTKTHQARDIELLDQAAAAIERQRKHTLLAGGEIFWNPNTGEPWNDEQVQRRYWNASLMRLGLRHREAYQTRHTFATIGLMAGCNPAWVARQMGHRSLKMFFEVYARWIDGADKGTQKALIDARTATKTATKGQR
jgi:integrase